MKLQLSRFANQVLRLVTLAGLDALGIALLFWSLRTGSRMPVYALLVGMGYNLIGRLVFLSKVKPWAPRCQEACDCGCGRPCTWALDHEGKHES